MTQRQLVQNAIAADTTWPQLQKLMQANLASHGDAASWDTALAALDELSHSLPPAGALPGACDPPLNSDPGGAQDLPAIGISHASNPTTEFSSDSSNRAASKETQQTLAATLQQLRPWRKGPWWLHGVHIDTEWRSDWKWQRLRPHLPNLHGQRILDVGSGNGYYGWQMLNAGATEVIGIDPTVLFVYQHVATAHLIAHLYPNSSNRVLPLRLEDLPRKAHPKFDSVFSMGVLYHRRDHMAHLQELRDQLAPGGTLVLETLVCEAHDLQPQGRYARMRNVHLLPKPETLSGWLSELGFTHTDACDITPTSTAEQRDTHWMRFESLAQALDPQDPSRTVEGHPAPVRACFVAHWTP